MQTETLIDSLTTHDQTDQLLQGLRAWMRSLGSVVVAYSGGVDSALVLAVASECLGNKALGCIGVSPSLPQRELDAAVQLAQSLGVRCRQLNTEEHLDPQYAANPSNRCYFCKSELYQCLAAVALEEGTKTIVDGTNASDLGGHRPGYAAAKERGVRSPLVELGINKENVRKMAQALGLKVWDKPSSPCLASRVPTGIPIVPQLLGRIERAENVLASLGFREFRVRHHGDVARIELPAECLGEAIAKRSEIVAGIRAAGYRFVSIDLAGLQSGSLSKAAL